ncbi:MAG TPA: contractile injection system protein, VgrG/Pvc8 family, partial [Paraburkholderia sp.]
MAEDNHARPRYITGRQSAHLTFTRRKAPPARESERDRPDALPEVSVVSWEIREEICKPYRVEAVIFASHAVARKAVLGQFAKFTIQPEDERDMRSFFGFVTRFEFLSESRDGSTYRIVVRQILAMLDGPSNCATYQRKSSPDIINEVLERNDMRHWMDVKFQ